MRLRAHPAACLRGRARVPGDKSISHRALLLAALAVGESRITGLLEGADVLATAAALGALGVELERHGDGCWRVQGRGVGGLAEPDRVLDLGNSGTAARLLLGVLAGHPFTTFMTGDQSLRSRPMGRVTLPLTRMGAAFLARSRERLPLAITGRADLLPIRYQQPVASAQVKSAVLLAGLHAPGRTTVIEPEPSRDHTERLLGQLGAELEIEALDGGGRAVTITGQPELEAAAIAVPGDISSAAFPLVAAAVGEGSALGLDEVGVNPLRTGLLDCLREMGAGLRQGDRGRGRRAGRRARDRRRAAHRHRRPGRARAPDDRRISDPRGRRRLRARARPGSRAWPSSGSRRATGWARSRAGSPPAGSRSRRATTA